MIPIPGNEDEWRRLKVKFKTNRYELILIANALDHAIQGTGFHITFRKEMNDILKNVLKDIGPMILHTELNPNGKTERT